MNETLILFRGISGSVVSRVINNSEYSEPAFASTAYDIAVSLDIFGPRTADGYQNVLVMQGLKGEHALFINDDEREFLIPRGSRWAVIKAVNIEKLDVNADFILHGCTSNVHQFEKVRLIYVKEIRSPAVALAMSASIK
ncbi:MAG TPA: hypothetical protein VN455_03880 [Methanotrichaceae archaeon]|nr:hypothetical protein [Methanotrichaceae archaeon]